MFRMRISLGWNGSCSQDGEVTDQVIIALGHVGLRMHQSLELQSYASHSGQGRRIILGGHIDSTFKSALLKEECAQRCCAVISELAKRISLQSALLGSEAKGCLDSRLHKGSPGGCECPCAAKASSLHGRSRHTERQCMWVRFQVRVEG
jgi:hypothetical protein